MLMRRGKNCFVPRKTKYCKMCHRSWNIKKKFIGDAYGLCFSVGTEWNDREIEFFIFHKNSSCTFFLDDVDLPESFKRTIQILWSCSHPCRLYVRPWNVYTIRIHLWKFIMYYKRIKLLLFFFWKNRTIIQITRSTFFLLLSIYRWKFVKMMYARTCTHSDWLQAYKIRIDKGHYHINSNTYMINVNFHCLLIIIHKKLPLFRYSWPFWHLIWYDICALFFFSLSRRKHAILNTIHTLIWNLP